VAPASDVNKGIEDKSDNRIRTANDPPISVIAWRWEGLCIQRDRESRVVGGQDERKVEWTYVSWLPAIT
jgi:hypothetical protein